jgi:hypothetical protein
MTFQFPSDSKVFQGDINEDLFERHRNDWFAKFPTSLSNCHYRCLICRKDAFIHLSSNVNDAFCLLHYNPTTHNPMNMTLVPHNQCIYFDRESKDQCQHHASYGIIDQKNQNRLVPLFCSAHAIMSELLCPYLPVDDVILLANQHCLCIDQDTHSMCTNKAMYCHPKDGFRIYCEMHYPDHFLRTKATLCIFGYCSTSASFGDLSNNDDPIPIHCEKHKLPSEKNIFSRKCEQEGCNIQPTFGYREDMIRRCCYAHKKDGMDSVHFKNGTQMCIGPSPGKNCPQNARATLGIPETKERFFCSKCNPDPKYYVRIDGTCNVKGCSKMKLKGKTHCAEHAPNGLNFTKRNPGCQKCNNDFAYFLPESEDRDKAVPIYCVNCIPDDGIPYVQFNRKCKIRHFGPGDEKCEKEATQGWKRIDYEKNRLNRNPIYCNLHVPLEYQKEMMNTKQRTCRYFDITIGNRTCLNRATYMFPGYKPTHCEEHKLVIENLPAMINETEARKRKARGGDEKNVIRCLRCNLNEANVDDTSPVIWCSSCFQAAGFVVPEWV